ncbi:hypothetical protein CRD60_02500 [Bifidobacterium aemilianum]|uniref:Beta-carotene 15,15'-monooxygenase n=2 Tax=Bifidobacterium aemilianum TaxID=2493120 RepID=A0A366KA06_9BIFI|nr:hypothetical protein CRD60_02500 [Bifidobacterium aemilianum]
MLIFAVAIGGFLALTLLVISMEEGGKPLSDSAIPLTQAVILLTQGTGFETHSFRLTLVPLLLTLLLIALIASLTRRSVATAHAYAAGLLTWTIINWIFTQGVSVALIDDSWLIICKTDMVFTLGWVVGSCRNSRWLARAMRSVQQHTSVGFRSAVRLGVSLALVLLALYLLFGLIAVLVWIVRGHEAMATLFQLDNMQMGSRILTSIAAVVWLPNSMMWALSWLFGGGFAIGDLASFTLWMGQSHALPPLPVFGLFPKALTNPSLISVLVSLPFFLSLFLGLLALATRRVIRFPARTTAKAKERQAQTQGKSGSGSDAQVRHLVEQLIYAAGSFCLTSALVALISSLCFALSNGSLGRIRLRKVGVDLMASVQAVGKPTAMGLFAAWLLAVLGWSIIFAIRWSIAKAARSKRGQSPSAASASSFQDKDPLAHEDDSEPQPSPILTSEESVTN